MFPHPHTVNAVNDLRLQDELRFAARQRLADTAENAMQPRPLSLAVRAGAALIGAWVRACLPHAVGERSAVGSSSGGERAEVAGAGLA